MNELLLDLLKSNNGKLAYSIAGFAEAVDIGETLIWEAVKSGELKTKKLVINGKGRKRRIIPFQSGADWLSTFPDYDETPPNKS